MKVVLRQACQTVESLLRLGIEHFQFPQGLIGFEANRRWILLADEGNAAVGWLQSANDAAIALPVISPRNLVPNYRLRLTREQLEVLQLESREKVFVLNVVGRSDSSLTANLKAPIIVNLDRRIGCQIVLQEDLPLQHLLAPASTPLRKSA